MPQPDSDSSSSTSATDPSKTTLPPVSRVSRRVWIVVGLLASAVLWVAGFSSDVRRAAQPEGKPLPRSETQAFQPDPALDLERRLRELAAAQEAAAERRRRQQVFEEQLAQRSAAPPLSLQEGASESLQRSSPPAFSSPHSDAPSYTVPQSAIRSSASRPTENPALRAYREAVEASPFDSARSSRSAGGTAAFRGQGATPPSPLAEIAAALGGLQPPPAPAASAPPAPVSTAQLNPAIPVGEPRSPSAAARLTPLPAPAPFTLAAGSIIPATLLNAVMTDVPGGVATALVRQDVYDSQGRHVLIPVGSRLVGTYSAQAAYGDTRVLLSWTRLSLPDGTSFNLERLPGADLEGAAGVFDRVDRHLVRLYGNALLLSVVSAAAQLSQPRSRDALQGPTAGETAAAALGQRIGDVTSGLIEREMNVRPTLTLRPGTTFNVVAGSDIIFPSGFRP